MAFCTKCGAAIENNVKFCTACGAPVEEVAQETAAPKKEAKQNESVSKLKEILNTENVGDAFKMLLDTPDTSDEYEAEDKEKNKVMAVLSYIGILVLIPIFAAKGSKFAKFHANQGLVLLLANLAYGVVTGLLGWLLGLIPVVGTFFPTVFGVLSLVFLAGMILGIYNAVKGNAKELPFIGGFKILK